jgi:hypothetical protein
VVQLNATHHVTSSCSPRILFTLDRNVTHHTALPRTSPHEVVWLTQVIGAIVWVP